ncbi:hypothetical protein PIROE2DRAFT_3274 [Piromyces sp. E2]|nr:hypothetical protein PIROE2DRAFT_3274 [Piromyces sp. E2]|eukprot:OUM68894.1 hypothetical protein PIROE2DRAFT_3274 [Piromyces sp. E2]
MTNFGREKVTDKENIIFMVKKRVQMKPSDKVAYTLKSISVETCLDMKRIEIYIGI